MSNKEEMLARAEAVFNAASDYFDAPALSFWNRFGQQTIDRLSLRNGDRILDVCCGTGASVIPAAGTHELAAPEDWWTIVLGGGLRGTIDQLDPAARERVREANMHFLQANEVHALEVNVLYAFCLQQCFAIAQKK